MIKKYLFSCALALATATLIAQVPNSFNYQSVVRDGFGVLVNSQQLGIKVSIVSDSLGGAVEYSETHSASTNANGLFSIQIGEGTAVSGVFDNIQWETGGLFYQVEIDLQGGSNYSLNSFHSFTSVPYAQHAQTTDSLVGFSKNSSGHYLGEIYGGGVIFHLWKDSLDVEHGLIVDFNDIPHSLPQFQCCATYPQTSSWDGKWNTNYLNSLSASYSVIGLVSNSTNGGFSDWYLPSIDELILLFNNRLIVHRSFSLVANSTQLDVYDPNYARVYLSSTFKANNVFNTLKFSHNESPSINRHNTGSQINPVIYFIRAIRQF